MHFLEPLITFEYLTKLSMKKDYVRANKWNNETSLIIRILEQSLRENKLLNQEQQILDKITRMIIRRIDLNKKLKQKRDYKEYDQIYTRSQVQQETKKELSIIKYRIENCNYRKIHKIIKRDMFNKKINKKQTNRSICSQKELLDL